MPRYTSLPQAGRWPHMAPVFGAQPIPDWRGARPMAQAVDHFIGVAEDGTPVEVVSGEGPQTPMPVESTLPPEREMLVDTALGLAMAGASGAVIGGAAGASWRGAGIGAGLNAGAWSLWTALGSWRQLEPMPRKVLLGAAGVGIVSAGVLYFTR